MSAQTVEYIRKALTIFKASDALIRPHFFLTGPSGSGKTFQVETLAQELDLATCQINAAQLTKEGTSGNSLSKALTPLLRLGDRPVVCFVDEFDKLFISDNNNALAHEITTGVQNEFLRVLESYSTEVYGDYGKYVQANCGNVLFIFAGAFNNEAGIDHDRLLELGVKTEFLGRVGLHFEMEKMSLDTILALFHKSELLDNYLKVFTDVSRAQVSRAVLPRLKKAYKDNRLGARIIHSLLHEYFITGFGKPRIGEKQRTGRTNQTIEQLAFH